MIDSGNRHSGGGGGCSKVISAFGIVGNVKTVLQWYNCEKN